jgi:hypothetical protein
VSTAQSGPAETADLRAQLQVVSQQRILLEEQLREAQRDLITAHKSSSSSSSSRDVSLLPEPAQDITSDLQKKLDQTESLLSAKSTEIDKLRADLLSERDAHTATAAKLRDGEEALKRISAELSQSFEKQTKELADRVAQLEKE